MPSKGNTKSKRFLVRYTNCLLLRDHQLIRENLWSRDGIIINPEKIFFDERSVADICIDCQGCIISPGFIDVQINGGFGVDFSLDTANVEAGLQTVSKGLLCHGVTSFCPTIITSSSKQYKQILTRVQKTEGSENGAGILGLHLEGPFISKEKKGAHPEGLIAEFRRGFQDVLDMYGSLNNVAILTLAPELEQAPDVIRELSRRGVRVAVGHSVASLAQGEAAFDAGAKFITHLFNAMLPFHHRDPHLVGLLATDHEVYYGVIADGKHTHAAALRIAYRVNPKGLVLVTDAVPGLGLPPGPYTIGTQDVEIKDDKAVIAGTDTLCGSIASMDFCVKHFHASTGCSLVEALEAATETPAKMLGITQRKGTLGFDSDADFVLLDKDLNLLATFIGGACVWEKHENVTITTYADDD
ncbi:N-acetylglucosamine-6-phosphate deacetylase-like [Lineus longissimus]|uniref:N-acetylglucosamine-6-phosphate deacetylase-like n=1 Tax=Lineus longissimus TaxID=88925 RepID=UPI002B4D1AE1